MSTFMITLILAFGVVVLALTLLGIGWLITGKSRMIQGACGMDPDRVRDKRCGTKDISCELCKKPLKEDDDEDQKEDDNKNE